MVKAPLNLNLARKQYQARYLQLRELIGEQEVEFKKLLGEIEDIRNGRDKTTQDDNEVSTSSFTRDRSTHSVHKQPVVNTDEAANSGHLEVPSASTPSPLENVDQLAPTTDQAEAPPEIETKDGDEQDPTVPSDPEATESENELRTEQAKDPGAEDEEKPVEPQDLSNPNSPQAIEIEDLLEPELEDEQEDPSQAAKDVHIPDEQQDEVVNPVLEDMAIDEPVTGDEPEEKDTPGSAAPSPRDEIEAQPEPSTPMEVDEEPARPSEPPVESGPAESSPAQEEHSDSKKAAEPTPEPEDAAEDEGASSGDEPLTVLRSRRGSRRGRSSTTAPRNAKARRRRRSSAAVDSPIAEQEMPAPEGGSDTGSPAPEAPPSKRQGKRRASVLEDTESSRDKKRARDGSEPVEEEESGTISASTARARRRADAQTPAKKFQNVIGMLHSQISQHRNGTIFHNPIRDSEAPDYHDIVKRPMDLKTIKAKIRDGAITNSLEFQRDIYLMFANAMMYNRPGSDVYVMAEDVSPTSPFYAEYEITEHL
ncbi:hypothetical protein V5O48_002333 [Marasmius crinis-equi]|uniref:Bromo domain-containing protein n=1 Tax=Marasmius crinis-equi TaxID=585013 RepID=A0ABR3FW45_9AGAR